VNPNTTTPVPASDQRPRGGWQRPAIPAVPGEPSGGRAVSSGSAWRGRHTGGAASPPYTL